MHEPEPLHEADVWTFWGGPACGERQVRVAASLAPSDPDANAPEHLRIEAQHDNERGQHVLHVHRYLAAPWPPAADCAPYWRYCGVTVESA